MAIKQLVSAATVHLEVFRAFVNDMLDSSQLHCGTFKLVKEPFDPNKTLELVLNIYKVEAEERGVRFFH